MQGCSKIEPKWPREVKADTKKAETAAAVFAAAVPVMKK